MTEQESASVRRRERAAASSVAPWPFDGSWTAEVDMLSELVRRTYGKPYRLEDQDIWLSAAREAERERSAGRGAGSGAAVLEFAVPVPAAELCRAIAGHAGPSMLEWMHAPAPWETARRRWDGSLRGGGLRSEYDWRTAYYPALKEVVDNLWRRGLLADGTYRLTAAQPRPQQQQL